MANIYTFSRTENKYILSNEIYEKLMSVIVGRLTPDSYFNSTVYSLYLDTEDKRLIRGSIDGGIYKEKLRIRAYNDTAIKGDVFLEIKKKYDGVVYKRRISAPIGDLKKYLYHGVKPEDSQIMNEIDYVLNFYGKLTPSMLITYDRLAFVSRDDKNLRITFDRNLRYKTDNMLLYGKCDGEQILSSNEIIMEIKSAKAVPLWLCSALDRYDLFPVSFSKYGTAFKINNTGLKGEIKNASNF